jgi:hypothetical protein
MAEALELPSGRSAPRITFSTDLARFDIRAAPARCAGAALNKSAEPKCSVED